MVSNWGCRQWFKTRSVKRLFMVDHGRCIESTQHWVIGGGGGSRTFWQENARVKLQNSLVTIAKLAQQEIFVSHDACIRSSITEKWQLQLQLSYCTATCGCNCSKLLECFQNTLWTHLWQAFGIPLSTFCNTWNAFVFWTASGKPGTLLECLEHCAFGILFGTHTCQQPQNMLLTDQTHCMSVTDKIQTDQSRGWFAWQDMGLWQQAICDWHVIDLSPTCNVPMTDIHVTNL